MSHFSAKSSFFIILGASTALLSTPAHAYLDPGTGSFILQMLVAGALGAMLYIKLAWANTKIFFARLIGGKSEKPTGDDSSQHQESEAGS